MKESEVLKEEGEVKAMQVRNGEMQEKGVFRGKVVAICDVT